MSFNLIAECYDLLSNPKSRISKESGLYKKLIKPKQRALDLACGTGPQALFLAEHCEAIVDANDLSSDMIAYAKEHRNHKNINYQIGDMSQKFDGQYQLIICVGNSLNLLPSKDLAYQTIHNSIESLVCGGALVVHIINPQATQNQKVKRLEKQISLANGKISITKVLTPHKTGRNLHITYKPVSGKIVEEDTELLDITKDELLDMCSVAEVCQLDCYGSLDCQAFTNESLDILVVLRKS